MCVYAESFKNPRSRKQFLFCAKVAATIPEPGHTFQRRIKIRYLVTYLSLKKAFYPATIPMPLVHIDTGHNFPETIVYRDKLVKQMGLKLIIGSVQDTIRSMEGATEEKRVFRFAHPVANNYLIRYY